MYGNVVNAVSYVADHMGMGGGGDEVTVRGMKTWELLMFPFIIHNTHQRFIVDPRRYVNPFAQVAETLWMLSGRNDLDWLERYIPQCKKFSDDGMTWRAGYGPRLRNWEDCCWSATGADNPLLTDQVEEVINKLVVDPFTRQAVISIWDPAQDWVQGSKDYPCNNWLHFIVRDGKLHLNVGVRSNDLIWGFTHVDFFGWAVLQELIANAVGVKPGKIHWNATSLHIYERHFQLVDSIQDTPLFDIYASGAVTQPLDIATLTDFDSLTQLMFNCLDETSPEIMTEGVGLIDEMSNWMFHALTLLLAHEGYRLTQRGIGDRTNNLVNVGALLMTLPEMLDSKIAAIYWLMQKIPNFLDYVVLTTKERILFDELATHASA